MAMCAQLDEAKLCVNETLSVRDMYSTALGTELVSNVCRSRIQHHELASPRNKEGTDGAGGGAVPSARMVADMLQRISAQTEDLGADIKVNTSRIAHRHIQEAICYIMYTQDCIGIVCTRTFHNPQPYLCRKA
jgi:hypothetical protein